MKKILTDQTGAIGLCLTLLVGVVVTIVGGAMVLKTSSTRDHVIMQRNDQQGQDMINSILADMKQKLANGEIETDDLEAGCWRDKDASTWTQGECSTFPGLTSGTHPDFKTAAAYRYKTNSVAGAPALEDGILELKVVAKHRVTGRITQALVSFVNYSLESRFQSPAVVNFINDADARVPNYLIPFSARVNATGSPIYEDFAFNLGNIDTRICSFPDPANMIDPTKTLAQSCSGFPAFQRLPQAIGVLAASTGPCADCTFPVPLGINSQGAQNFSGATVNLIGTSNTNQPPQFVVPVTRRSLNFAHGMKVPIDLALKKLKEYYENTTDGDTSNNYPYATIRDIEYIPGNIYTNWPLVGDSYPPPHVLYFNGDIIVDGMITGYAHLVVASPLATDADQKTTVVFNNCVSLMGTIIMAENTRLIFRGSCPGKVISDRDGGIFFHFKDPAKMPLISAPLMTFGRMGAHGPEGVGIGDALHRISQMGQEGHTRGNRTFDLASFELHQLLNSSQP